MKHRILHVIDHTGSGGAQVVIQYLLRALKDEFFFAVAVIGSSGEFSERYKSLDVPVYKLSNGGGRWNPSPIVMLANIIRRQKFDLVHTHLFKANILGTIAARWVATRTILHDHSGIYPQALLKYCFSNGLIRCSYLYAYRFALSECDRVLVLTPGHFKSYLEYYSLDPYKITILPNAVNPDDFGASAKPPRGMSLRLELDLSPNTRLVMMVARLHPMKDWLTFLQVARQVGEQWDQPCGFLVVGSGSEEQNLRSYVKAHKLEQIFFLGYREDVPRLLQEVDIFLLTSRCEPFGIAALEAMAAGCPVVATRSGGPESILKEGVDGLLAEVGDVNVLTKHVVHLLNDKALARRLAYNAQRTVFNHYNHETITARMADIYSEVIG